MHACGSVPIAMGSTIWEFHFKEYIFILGTQEKEFDRRHLGQELNKAKRDREERQAHDIVNQIKEARAKERAHREAVRQQIARERAE